MRYFGFLRPPNTVSHVQYVSRNPIYPRQARPGERLSNGTVDALGRRRLERMTLGVEHV